MRNLLMILALGVTLMSSDCSPDSVLEITTDANINFVATYDNEPFVAQHLYDYDDGIKMQVDQFSFFISNIVLLKQINTSGSETELKEIVLLDFSDMDNHLDAANGITVSTEGLPIGDYEGIKFGIGVASDLNRTKPVEYSDEHPLSLPDLYQSEYKSYIFSRLIGQVDKDNDGILDSNFGYGAATDELYREQILVSKFTLSENSTYNLKLNIDIKRLLGTADDHIDIVNNLTESDFNISRIISNNFAAAISIE